MKLKQDTIDEALECCFPSASKEQIESARGRLYDRMRSQSERDHAHQAPPVPHHSRGRLSYVIGAMAAFIVGVVIWLALPDRSIDAVLETADGSAYRTAEGKTIPINAGEGIRPGEIVRSSASSGSTIALADGSRVEMRAGSELLLERADDGIRIRLNNGSVIVSAARQQPGRHLYVQTKDLTVSVVGTVFLVKADDDGSRVAVIEGAVRVLQGTHESDLQPGEQLSSNAKLAALALQVEVGWSRQAAAYLALLHQAMAKSLMSRQTPSLTTSISDTPRFEEAAIRQCSQDFAAPEGARGGGSNSLRLSPGRFDGLCLTVATLIRTAYSPLANASVLPHEGRPIPLNRTAGLGMEDGTNVRGGPDWVRSEKYTITAIAPGDTDARTLQGPMLRELLERRFHLRAHVDAEEIRVMELKIGQNGLKMKRIDPANCVPTPRFGRGDSTAVGRMVEEFRRNSPTWCGDPEIAAYDSGFNRILVSGKASTALLVEELALSSVMGNPSLNGLRVLDKTGQSETDLFRFVLEYATAAALTAQPGLAPDLPVGLPLPAALEQQLGLKLEPGKGSREFIVIDHVERPSPN